MTSTNMAEPAAAEAFLASLEAHRGILYKVSSLYCANAADREDLAQEIVAQLWRSYARFDGRSRFSTWMYRVALNVAISWVREDRVRRERIATDAALLEARLADQAVAETPPELHVLLTEILTRLPVLDRALLLLYLDGEDHASIAAVLGLSPTNVATKIARLRQKLEKEISA